MSTLVPSPTADSPSLLRSLLVATATVALLALSLGALYSSAEPDEPVSSLSAR